MPLGVASIFQWGRMYMLKDWTGKYVLAGLFFCMTALCGILSGCSESPEDEFYQAFKCAKVASMLEQEAEAELVMRNAAPLASKISGKGSPARYAMMMGDRFQDDVPLYKYGLSGQIALLRDVYNSSRCQKLYRSDGVKSKSETIKSENDNSSEPAAQGDETPVPQENEAQGIVGGEVSASDREVVENAITVAAKSEMGEEYKDARHVLAGDLNGDGAIDAVVLFTVEVGSENRTAQYLSVFTRQTNGVLRFVDTSPVGGTGSEAIDGVGIVNGSIKLKTLTRGQDDPDCCPSVSGEKEFLLHDGKLKQVF